MSKAFNLEHIPSLYAGLEGEEGLLVDLRIRSVADGLGDGVG
jgi:hypothetical protein